MRYATARHSFATLTGQRHVTSVLRRAVTQNVIPQQLLFAGGSGLGKTTVARIFAASILCTTDLSQRDDGDACGTCESCVLVSESDRQHPDLIEFDAASNGGKDDIKEIAQRASLAPLRGRWKVYIIDEAHGLSGPGGQAFLKLLEEPPPHVIFMLATTDPQKMLTTNRSRCLIFELLRPTDDELISNIERVVRSEHWTLDASVAQAVLDITDPATGVRGTLMTLEKLSGQLLGGGDTDSLLALLGVPPRELVGALTDALSRHSYADAFTALDTLKTQVSDSQIRAELLRWGRTELIADPSSSLARYRYAQVVETPPGAAWTDVLVSRLTSLHQDPSPTTLQAMLDEAGRVMKELSGLLQTASTPTNGSSYDAAELTREIERARAVGNKLAHYSDRAEQLMLNSGASASAPAALPAPQPTTASVPLALEPSATPVSAPAAPPPAAMSAPAADVPPPPDDVPPPDDIPPPDDAPPPEDYLPPSEDAPPPDQAPRRPSRKPRTPRSDPTVPKAPRNKVTPPATAATVTSTSAQLLLSAVPTEREDIKEFIQACKVGISDAGITVSVPKTHHKTANSLAQDIRLAGARLRLKVAFASL